MKFYDCQPAPSPRRARMFIAEKGLNIETVQIDLGSKEQLGDAFKKINPHCTVPVLQLDDGSCLTENISIAHYLEGIHPEPPLFGGSAVERAMVMEWNTKAEMVGLLALAEVLRNSSEGFKNRATTGPNNFAQIPELAERGRERFQAFFPMINAQLEKTPYLAGDSLSIADITAFVVTDFAAWVKEAIPEECTAVKAWHKKIKARPSAQL